jgi:glycosyltransferase involved in cell wall biosynthesis
MLVIPEQNVVTRSRAEVEAVPPAKTVLLVTYGGSMAGVEFNTRRLARRLDPTKWNVLVVCARRGDLYTACRHSGIHTEVVYCPRLFSTSVAIGHKLRLPNPLACFWDVAAFFVASRRLMKFFRKTKPAVVVTKGLFPHFYGGLAARWAGIPCVWHAEDFISERWRGLFRRFFALASRFLPTRIVAIGEPVARQLPLSVQDKVQVIYNGSDTDSIQPGMDGSAVRQELGIALDAPVVGLVARLTAWKGQHYLLEAFARLVKKVPEARLVFVGAPLFGNEGYEQRLRGRAKELGLADHVLFAGHRQDVSRVLAAIDVLAYTAVEKDNCPLSLLEAMAAGVPVVAFDIEGIRLVLPNPEDGLLVPVGDVDALADSIQQILADPKLRQNLSHGARRRVVEAFSLNRHVACFDDVLSSLSELGA